MRKQVTIAACIAVFVGYLVAFVGMLYTYAPSTVTQFATAAQSDPLLVLSTATLTVDGVAQEVQLPYTPTDLDPRTEVTIRANITPPDNYSFYIESDGTPLAVYLDDTLV